MSASRVDAFVIMNKSEEEDNTQTEKKKGCCSSCCCCCGGCCRLDFKNNRTPQEKEVVRLFLDNRKYGLPGSDGTLFSNWWRYVSNHDPLLAILFTHPMNTYGRFKRLMLQVCIVGFTLFMNVWSSNGSSPEWVGVIISIIILQPVQLILEQLASIADPPCCLFVLRSCADFFFYAIAFAFAFVFWLVGGLELQTLSSDQSVRNALVGNIFLSICVSQVKVQLFDIPNWLIEDWRNVPLLCGFDPDFGLFDLFLFKCLCGGEKDDVKEKEKESLIINDEEKKEQKKKGCCASCWGGCFSCCTCCCTTNYCCGMFTQAGFWFMVGMAVGFPTSTYAADKDWFQNHPADEKKKQPAYRKGAVAVDDPDLLVLEDDKEAIQIVIDEIGSAMSSFLGSTPPVTSGPAVVIQPSSSAASAVSAVSSFIGLTPSGPAVQSAVSDHTVCDDCLPVLEECVKDVAIAAATQTKKK